MVFRHQDHRDGRTRYIYHGNDGTSMPWNDTAQLNYLIPEVREAVIQTILHVARQFPIIRFDAAMTLAKKHYQRLWFPEPGHGGAIPSRAEHGMTRPSSTRHARGVLARGGGSGGRGGARYAAAGRGVLDDGGLFRAHAGHAPRLQQRLHEHAARRRRTPITASLKNTLEFDPEVLKRFVNFMNNPDERTAVDQFGKGDKYFGVCTLMATLPGLPMFGHGQIEGFARNTAWSIAGPTGTRRPDDGLVRRHEREIFPLLHRRYLFAGVEDFLLYDFYAADGTSTRMCSPTPTGPGDERGIVSSITGTATPPGWISLSAAMAIAGGRGAASLSRKNSGEALGFNPDDRCYYDLRDSISGLEYPPVGEGLLRMGSRWSCRLRMSGFSWSYGSYG